MHLDNTDSDNKEVNNFIIYDDTNNYYQVNIEGGKQVILSYHMW